MLLLENLKMLAQRAVLTYFANRTTNVPMCADAFGLLVFGASITSVCVIKVGEKEAKTFGISKLF